MSAHDEWTYAEQRGKLTFYYARCSCGWRQSGSGWRAHTLEIGSLSTARANAGHDWAAHVETITTSIIAGLAIIGATTAAKKLLQAAELARTDQAAAVEKLRDAIACAAEALDTLTHSNFAEAAAPGPIT